MQNFGLNAERFDLLAQVETEHFWFVARRELLIGLLRQHVPQKVPLLLDLGCGPGLNLSYWREFSDQVMGVDQHLVEPSASQSDAPNIVKGDVIALPFGPESADLMLLLDVLEHVDDRKALAEAFRVLKPNGALLLSVPAHPWLWGARDAGADHLRRYSRRGLRETVEAAGFVISAVHPYQFLLMPLVILSRVIGKVSSRSRDMEDRPLPLVNSVLKWINRMEVRASLSLMPMPTGSSYTLLARKPG